MAVGMSGCVWDKLSPTHHVRYNTPTIAYEPDMTVNEDILVNAWFHLYILFQIAFNSLGDPHPQMTLLSASSKNPGHVN